MAPEPANRSITRRPARPSDHGRVLEDVEHRLARAVGRGAGRLALRRPDRPAAQAARDDAQGAAQPRPLGLAGGRFGAALAWAAPSRALYSGLGLVDLRAWASPAAFHRPGGIRRPVWTRCRACRASRAPPADPPPGMGRCAGGRLARGVAARRPVEQLAVAPGQPQRLRRARQLLADHPGRDLGHRAGLQVAKLERPVGRRGSAGSPSARGAPTPGGPRGSCLPGWRR